MTTKAMPFNKHEAENRVISRIAEGAGTSEGNIRRLVKAEDSDICDKLEDGVRIEALNARFGKKLCEVCGGSLN